MEMYKYEPLVKKFYDGLDAGVFYGRKCLECGTIEFPPYPACNNCGNIGSEWVELTGEDVTVEEVYQVRPMYTVQEYMPYAPIFSAECKMDHGVEFVCLIFGITLKTYDQVRDSVPLKAKLVVMPMEGYNTFAVGINGAIPVRGEKRENTEMGKAIFKKVDDQ